LNVTVGSLYILFFSVVFLGQVMREQNNLLVFLYSRVLKARSHKMLELSLYQDFFFYYIDLPLYWFPL